MTPGEIEQQTRADTSWQRPTWPLGRLGAATWEDELLQDPMNILADRRRGRAERVSEQHAPTELREPLATLGLGWPTTLDAVKTRYKELAKRHHPDANGGDRAAEERLKTINLAYAAVRRGLAAEQGLRAAG
jgi:DnaJ-domain-containing protein 1